MTAAVVMTNKTNKSQRVLVVDSNPETREQLGAALAQAGFSPVLASTGEQGLVLLRDRSRRIDWLYTKTDLPGLVDGCMLADEFQRAYSGRLVLYGVGPGEKGSVLGRGIVVDGPVKVVEALLALSEREDAPAIKLTRWAA
jgi:CheY-like chemotaxis protein